MTLEELMEEIRDDVKVYMANDASMHEGAEALGIESGRGQEFLDRMVHATKIMATIVGPRKSMEALIITAMLASRKLTEQDRVPDFPPEV